ncbi:MAG: DNA cytosine methyltransferase [Luteimonas sp.]
MSDLLSAYDVSGRLDCSEQYVRKLLREGQMAGEKIGGAWTVRESAVEAYQTGAEPDIEPVEDHPVRQREKGGIKALSFFSGAMGLDLGLERAGIKVSLACEFDKACRATIQENRPGIALLTDINHYDAAQIREAAGLGAKEEIHLIAGGPPCQAFSSAGQRRGFDDARGNVFLKYIELGLALSPRYLAIENVRGLLSAALKHRPHDQRGKGFAPLSSDELPGGALTHAIGMLEDAGYGVSFNLYNAANFGSPQTRERVVLIAARGGRVLPFLAPTHSEQGQHGLPRWRTFRQAVRGMTKVEHDFVRFPEKRLKYYRMLEAGQNWRDLPPKLQKEALGNSYFAGGGKTGFLRRLAWDKPAPTLVTHPAMPATDLCHPVKDRPLSVQEYARLQEFPDKWQFRGSLLEKYRQIGNAVPAGLGHALGKLVVDALADGPTKTNTSFPYSRYRETDHVSWRQAMTRQAALFDPSL